MICTKMRNRFKRVLQQFDKYVDEHIDTALQVTTALKQMLSSPVADVVTALIPGELDNLLRQRLLIALERAITILTITEQCKKYAGTKEKVYCFVEQLKAQSPELQDALLQKLASLMTSELDGNRLKQSLYDLYTQAKYAASKQ